MKVKSITIFACMLIITTVFSVTGSINDVERLESDEILASSAPLEPSLEITSIKGFIGVTADVRNKGNTDTSNVQWEIEVGGNNIYYPQSGITTGTIPMLGSGVRRPISTLVFGFGKAYITVRVSCTNSSDVKTISAFLLGPFVL